MTDDELLCAYLLRFGTDTIGTPEYQEGELEFLRAATEKPGASIQNAWARITSAYMRRKMSEAQLAE